MRGKFKVWFTGLAHLWADRLTALKSYTEFDRKKAGAERSTTIPTLPRSNLRHGKAKRQELWKDVGHFQVVYLL